jgi:hypothetical protein
MRTGSQAVADDHAKATAAGRDAGAGTLPSRSGRDDAAAWAGRDGDDEAKATGAAGGEGDATSRTAADTKGAAAGTSAAAAGSVSGAASKPAEAGPRTPGDAEPPSATPAGEPASVGRPSATQREAHRPAEGAGGRAPEAGSGTGTAGLGPAPARDGDERGATEQGGAGRSGPTRAADGNAVVIVPGIARYHRTGCILIRFLGSDDLETSTAQEAEAKGCAPCRACEPDKPLSSGD